MSYIKRWTMYGAIGGAALSFGLILLVAGIIAAVVSIATVLAGGVIGLVIGILAAITSPMRKKKDAAPPATA
ncbi:MAG: hypothetical protein FJ314_08135 [SAR202 cluster bacterium]|nr:hypothetical protein [SAR202 cluster bacterium]